MNCHKSAHLPGTKQLYSIKFVDLVRNMIYEDIYSGWHSTDHLQVDRPCLYMVLSKQEMI